MEDEKLVALLQAMEDRLESKLESKLLAMEDRLESKLESKLTAGFAAEHEFLKKALVQIEANLGLQVQNLADRMDRQFEQVDRRFDQINARLSFVDSGWKLARRWGVLVDDHRMKNDKVIADLVADMTDLKERVIAIEKKQQ
jgi:hypothetical protein